MKPPNATAAQGSIRMNRATPPHTPTNAFPKPRQPQAHRYNFPKELSESKAMASRLRITNAKANESKSPVNTLTAGGNSANNRGLLSKFKDLGSDCNEKEDSRKCEQADKPNFPARRLKD